MMFNHARPGLRGIAIALAFVLLGFAQQSGANDAEVNSDNSEIIEEIVVMGAKKSRRSIFGRGLSTDPVIKKPKRLDWQFFPDYDPDRATIHNSDLQIDGQFRRNGFIEVFRIRFGG